MLVFHYSVFAPYKKRSFREEMFFCICVTYCNVLFWLSNNDVLLYKELYFILYFEFLSPPFSNPETQKWCNNYNISAVVQKSVNYYLYVYISSGTPSEKWTVTSLWTKHVKCMKALDLSPKKALCCHFTAPRNTKNWVCNICQATIWTVCTLQLWVQLLCQLCPRLFKFLVNINKALNSC